MNRIGVRMMRPSLGLFLALAMACGPGAEEVETGPDGEGTSGSEVAENTHNDGADPCAEDPDGCAEGTRSGENGENGEGENGEGENGEGENGEGENGEGENGEATENGETAENGEGTDALQEWRNSVGRGRSVFRQACDTCHPNGQDDQGPAIRRRGLSVENMTSVIQNGTGRMRRVRIPERFMSDLMAYLSTMGAVRGVERPE